MGESGRKSGQFVVTVRFSEPIDISTLGTLSNINLYLVKNSFTESGIHLNPKGFKVANWKNLPFSPERNETKTGIYFDYFEIHIFDNPYYSSSIDGYAWTIAISMNDFEKNFKISENNKQFELFVIRQCNQTGE